MGSNKSGRHMIDLLFTLALFCVFAASALLVVLIGAGVYQNTVRHMDAGYYSRTAITYVDTKIRQNDRAGAIYLSQIGSETAIVLEQPVDDQIYQTWIYHHDGAIRELFIEKGLHFQPEDGPAVVDIPDFEISLEDGSFLLTSVDTEGVRTSSYITPRCGTVGQGEAIL